MTKKIGIVLIGTSLGTASEEVVHAGLAVARAAGARVYLAHAYQLEWPWSGGTTDVSELMVEEVFKSERMLAERRLQAQVERLDLAPGELAGTHVEFGAPHRILVETAERIGAGLLVVGAAESPLMPRIARLFGSTADRVVRASLRPVLVVQGHFAVPPRRVLLPVDLSLVSAAAFRHGLAILEQIAPEKDAVQLEALFVLAGYDPEAFEPGAGHGRSEAEAAHDLARFVKENGDGRPVAVRLARGEVGAAIGGRLAEWGADLVVLGTHGRGGFERFLLGSATTDVIRRGATSVLVIPPPPAAESAAGEKREGEEAVRHEPAAVHA